MIKIKEEIDFDKFLNAWKDMEDSSGKKLTASDVSAISEQDKLDAIKRRFGYNGAYSSIGSATAIVASTPVSAERVEELENTIAALEARVRELEKRVGKPPSKSNWKGKL